MDLSKNALQQEDLDCLWSALLQNRSLRVLILAHNGSQDTGMIIGPALPPLLLCQAMQQNDSLTRLDLSHCLLASASLTQLCEGLHANTTLSHLSLQKCGLSEGTAGVEIGQMLMCNTGLTCLDLSLNHIGKNEAVTIASALATNCHLRTLNLVRTRQATLQFLFNFFSL